MFWVNQFENRLFPFATYLCRLHDSWPFFNKIISIHTSMQPLPLQPSAIFLQYYAFALIFDIVCDKKKRTTSMKEMAFRLSIDIKLLILQCQVLLELSLCVCGCWSQCAKCMSNRHKPDVQIYQYIEFHFLCLLTSFFFFISFSSLFPSYYFYLLWSFSSTINSVHCVSFTTKYQVSRQIDTVPLASFRFGRFTDLFHKRLMDSIFLHFVYEMG